MYYNHFCRKCKQVMPCNLEFEKWNSNRDISIRLDDMHKYNGVAEINLICTECGEIHTFR